VSANDKLLGYPVTGDMLSHQVFATNIHHTSLVSTDGWQELNDDLEAMAMSLAEDDEPGIEWCEENGYDGYTSYSSLDDLTQRATCFATLGALLQKQAEAFAELRAKLGYSEGESVIPPEPKKPTPSRPRVIWQDKWSCEVTSREQAVTN
jgi:hypothetical protein